MQKTLLVILLMICTLLSAAGPKLEGVYENDQSNASVEFMPAGKGHCSLYGVGGACSYKIEGTKVTVNLEGEAIVFTINSDGSLSGPQGTYYSRLKKKK